MVRSVLLLGSRATDLGEIHTAGLGAATAIGLSRGRFPKGYPHTDPNEDACLAATDGTATLLAVADGHNGAEAAEAVIEALTSAEDPLRIAHTDPVAAAARALEISRVAIGGLPHGSQSHTALTVVLLSPAGAGLAQAGDTVAFVASGRKVRVLNGPAPFLGREFPSEAPGAVSFSPPRSGETVVLASDGLVDFLGRNPMRVLAPLIVADDPVGSVEAVVGAAFAGGAGDNVAVVVHSILQVG